jgi:mannan endo-1,4-beta-mannosidase
MHHSRRLTPIAALLAVLMGGSAMADGFVAAVGSKLMLDGKEYRAIGVNMPNLHQAYFGTWFHNKQMYGSDENARQAMIAGVEDASRSGLAFIRFFANPGYPRDQAMLYDQDPDRYWKLMDEVFDLCRRNRIKLVPSLQTIPGPYLHLGEHGQAIIDPQSKTYQWVHRYITEFVTRYKDDPTVLMWELMNEGTLHADVEMEGRALLPKGVYPPGVTEVREKGSMDDSLTWAMFQRLYREQTAFIKSLDPNHLVTSGDAHVRPECTSRRETFPNFKFRSDTWREWLGNNLAAQPEPLDVFSFHFYGNDEIAGPGKPWTGMTALEEIQGVARCVHAARAPMFIGELGTSPNNRADPESKWLLKCVDMLESEGVSLAALWVWHFTWQPEYTLDGTSAPTLVKRCAEFNRTYAGLR